MYCPKCGKENSEQQKFCKSCGLRLESVSQTIANDSGRGRDDRFILSLGGGQKGWQDPLTYGFILIAAGMLWGAIGYKVLGEKTLGDIGTLIALVGIFVIFLKGIFLVIPTSSTTPPPPKTLVEGSPETIAPAALQPKEQVALLSAEPPSITEHTTKHLEPGLQDQEERPRTTQPTLQ